MNKKPVDFKRVRRLLLDVGKAGLSDERLEEMLQRVEGMNDITAPDFLDTLLDALGIDPARGDAVEGEARVDANGPGGRGGGFEGDDAFSPKGGRIADSVAKAFEIMKQGDPHGEVLFHMIERFHAGARAWEKIGWVLESIEILRGETGELKRKKRRGEDHDFR